MAIKIFSILLALFIIAFTLISLQDPYSINLKNYGVDFKNISASKLSAYELNATHATALYTAEKWTRYKDRDEFENVKIQNTQYSINANSLESANELIKLRGNVEYSDIESKKIQSEEASYNKALKTLQSSSDFKAILKQGLVLGRGFEYNLNDKNLHIREVRAWIEK